MAKQDQDLNVFEILGEKEPDSEKPPDKEPEEWNEWSKYFENRIEERHSWNASGQERNAPDRFFDEEIIQAMSEGIPQSSPEKKQSTKKTRPAKNTMHAKKPKSSHKRNSAQREKHTKKQIAARKRLPQKTSVEDSSSGTWKRFLVEIAAVILAVVLITQFFVSISYVSGDSMLPAFHEGDRVLIQRFAKGGIEKGDVIVFETEDGEKLIKRVVATEGDTVDISKNQGGLYINGEAVEESYIYTATTISDDQVTYPVAVGKDSYFVLGDNRTNSKDSRDAEIGLVEKKDIVGKVILSIRTKTGEENEAAAGKDTQ